MKNADFLAKFCAIRKKSGKNSDIFGIFLLSYSIIKKSEKNRKKPTGNTKR